MYMIYVDPVQRGPVDGPPVWVSLAGGALEGLSAGVEWSCNTLVGWWEATGTTGQVVQRAFQSGGWANQAFSEPRTLVVGGLLRAPDRPAARLAIEGLMSLLSVNELVPLVVTEDGLTRHAMVRQEGKPVVEWLTDTLVSWNVQLVAPDWRRLAGDGSGATRSVSTGLPSSSGGLVFPASAPFLFDAVVVSGEVAVVNVGTAPAPVVVSFQGPVSNPSVQLRESGEVMSFALDVLAGQVLEVDFDRRSVRLNGVSRRGSLRGRWFDLSSGSSTLKFDAAAFSSAATMTVSWSDAWK